MRVLLLGGTGEARALARRLVDLGIDVTTSLAGRVNDPTLPVGAVRIGGFGGVEGLREAAADFDVVVDATHPFARGISANAAAACTEVPLLRFQRPAWPVDPRWRYVASHEEAANLAAVVGRRPFLTVGRQELARFTTALAAHAVLARVVDAPDLDVPSSWTILASRGPYAVDGELEVMTKHRADVLITKDSGGALTWPKMEVAGRLDIPVIVVERPASDPAVTAVDNLDDAVAWIESHR
ncbi:cobalt-precorrin-6A reductase [Aeromicrobium sp. P5_D10]